MCANLIRPLWVRLLRAIHWPPDAKYEFKLLGSIRKEAQ